MELWDACQDGLQPGLLAGTLYRLVESQEQVATQSITSSLDRQSVLEDLLEASKPPAPMAAAGLHYLLATPFRYPPLPWGSRFGTRSEPSLFYASLSPHTLFAEAAYYRMVFWHGLETPPPGPLRTQHSLFSARYRTYQGLRLQDPPCAGLRAELTHCVDYAPTQRLGARLREAGIRAFQYPSARDPASGINVALFTPEALVSRRPRTIEPWLCETTADEVHFYEGRSQGAVHRHRREGFLVDGCLPRPA